MKRMKFLMMWCLMGAGVWSSTLWAQSSQEFEVQFQKLPHEAEGHLSAVFEIEEFQQTPFVSLSAYVMQAGLELELKFRLKSGNNWSEWQSLELNHEGETPDRTTFFAPYIEENFEAIQFASESFTAEEVVFRLYFPLESSAAEPKMKAANDTLCSCRKPAYCGRDCWCPSGNCPKNPTPSYTTPTHIIIHHSAGSSVSNNWPAVVKAIWDFHVNTNGWSDVGYNWLIDPNGVIYEGRGDSVLGAHFSCMNSGTLGICMLGNFENAQPSFSMISSLSYLIAWEACLENIPPLGGSLHASSQLVLPYISSHRDGNTSTAPNGCPKGTLCPGANLYVLLPGIRQAVANNPCTGSLSTEEVISAGFKLYPNPVQSLLSIEYTSAKSNMKAWEIRHINGQIVKRSRGTNLTSQEINVSDLSEGIYLFHLELEDGAFHQQLFVKN